MNNNQSQRDYSASDLWNGLKTHVDRIKKRSLSDILLQREAGEKYFAEFDGLLLDFSKQFLNKSVLDSLCLFANRLHLRDKIRALYSGDWLNATEKRPALHTALRLPAHESLLINGDNLVQAVHSQLSKMETLVDDFHNGRRKGCTGKNIRNIVNIGVGGSHLGPFMVTHALEEFTCDGAHELNLFFVSSMDGTQIHKVLERLDPEETLFIVSSKSFSTADTFYNANTAIAWLLPVAGSRLNALNFHFVGISASKEKMLKWGIPAENQLQFWDWVGGRFSLWSTIGLPIALKIGMDRFREMLAGANAVDRHFYEAPFEKNIPVLLALIGVWNTSFLDINAHAILPYDARLQHFPAYLTQLEMESNGKNAKLDGTLVNYKTAPIIWGDVGCDAQHAFYQLLHQGTQRVSADFIAAINRYDSVNLADMAKQSLQSQHKLTLANCIAQSRVLALGNLVQDSDVQDSLAIHKKYNGNQPSCTILLEQLNPESLGKLIAIYEHKVFAMGALWNINSFDQWGVEMGKRVSLQVIKAFNQGTPEESFDESSKLLINHILQKRIRMSQ